MKPLISLLFILTVSGCATGHWTHAHGDPVRFERDNLECDYEAQKASAGGRTMADRVSDRVYLRQACMQVRGYYWVRTAE